MKIDAENTLDPAQRKGALADAAAKYNTALETSIIPALGQTFAEADIKTGDDQDWDAAADAAEAIHTTPPVTLGDALVKLRALAGPLGVAGGGSDCHILSVNQISAFLTSSSRRG